VDRRREWGKRRVLLLLGTPAALTLFAACDLKGSGII